MITYIVGLFVPFAFVVAAMWIFLELAETFSEAFRDVIDVD